MEEELENMANPEKKSEKKTKKSSKKN
jgi:hypothetical protein